MNLLFKVRPKKIQLLNHSLLLFTAFFFFDLARTPIQIISCIVCSVITEFALIRLTNNRKRHWLESFESALISALGLLLIVRSPLPWLYALLGFISIASKWIFYRPDKGHHIFNPTNFGIVTAFVVFNEHIVFVPDQYSVLPHGIIQTLLLGLWVTYLANRWLVSLSYLFINFIFAITLGEVFGMPYIIILGSETGVTSLLLTFFMITDPRTTPDNRFQQILFGSSVGVIALCFKAQSILMPQFFALFLVSPIWHFLSFYYERWKLDTAQPNGISR